MNPTQVTSTVAPIIAFIAGVLSTKFAFFDQQTWIAIITAIAGAVAVVWNAIATRNKNMAQTLGDQGMKVVAPPDVAAATKSINVVSSADVKVVQK